MIWVQERVLDEVQERCLVWLPAGPRRRKEAEEGSKGQGQLSKEHHRSLVPSCSWAWRAAQVRSGTDPVLECDHVAPPSACAWHGSVDGQFQVRVLGQTKLEDVKTWSAWVWNRRGWGVEAERRGGSPRVPADASPPGPGTVARKRTACGEILGQNRQESPQVLFSDESPAVPVLYLQTTKREWGIHRKCFSVSTLVFQKNSKTL